MDEGLGLCSLRVPKFRLQPMLGFRWFYHARVVDAAGRGGTRLKVPDSQIVSDCGCGGILRPAARADQIGEVKSNANTWQFICAFFVLSLAVDGNPARRGQIDVHPSSYFADSTRYSMPRVV